MRANRTATAQNRPAERPNCWACHDRGWTFIGDDRSLPIRRSCTYCTDQPAEDFDFWGMTSAEEPGGDVDESGRFVSDAA